MRRFASSCASGALSLKPYQLCDITGRGWTAERPGEQKIWQALEFVPAADTAAAAATPPSVEALRATLAHARDTRGVRYVLLGIPEDIGPRANCGRGGAGLGWEAFLSRFLNLQANRFFPTDNKVLLLGEIDSAALLARQNAQTSPEELRPLVAELDGMVEPVMREIFDAGLEPIVIGGGHNNCYPILAALHGSSGGGGCVAANLDPHADFREAEGRHSGNGFRYAHEEQMLRDYFVVCLHEYKNNEAILAALDAAGFGYDSYQKLRVRKEKKFAASVQDARQRLEAHGLPLGVEVDTDCISYMPVSAFTNTGVSVDKAEYFVHHLARSKEARYLHLCEAAPGLHPQGLEQGMNEGGQILAALVLAFIQGRELQRA